LRDEAAFLDPSIWVHEMKHVEQFKAYGIDNFAEKYMNSWNSIEDPAYAIENQYKAQSAASASQQPPNR
jgi:hypothetical protein